MTAFQAARQASEAVLAALHSRDWEKVLPALMTERAAAIEAVAAAIRRGERPDPGEAEALLDLDARIGEGLSLRRLELERERKAIQGGRGARQGYGPAAATGSRYVDAAG